ncbi:MAG: F0F1 ATP synthase subunit alpha [Kiritimatiellae bacterium]|nr:F0F1 ATP synthase subunit alpha [Kiritimatiellia bacterium]
MGSIHIDAQEITRVLEENLRDFSVPLGVEEVGEVVEAGDGIARISGLPGVMAEEMLIFGDNVHGMAMNLERNQIGAIVLGDYAGIRQGSVVKRTGKVLQVPVGEPLLGRVVNSLGQPIDGRGPIVASEYRLVDAEAPGIVDREPVNTPLQTGLKSIDALTPIGRGQRELIIGDRQTGKTTVAIDAVLNQTPGDVRCVYVAIGQKMSTVVRLVELLEEHEVLSNCIVVVATADASAPLQYLAPFAGCAMAEYFRDAGGDALVIYDDLSKHAVAYRQMSLLLRRPPGREAYPGDIFYLHSRLLERAAKLHPDKGGGSLTVLPIIETLQGDYSAYIPTNLISITDGQIYLEPDLFHQGFRPAINVGLSVSRVGSKAQIPAMKQVSGMLRIDFAQYRELAAFAQLTSELDSATTSQLHRGARLAEVFKQRPNKPIRVDRQVCILWAAARGMLDAIPSHAILRFETELFTFLDHTHPALGQAILDTGALPPEREAELERAVQTFTEMFAEIRPPGETAPAREETA